MGGAHYSAVTGRCLVEILLLHGYKTVKESVGRVTIQNQKQPTDIRAISTANIVGVERVSAMCKKANISAEQFCVSLAAVVARADGAGHAKASDKLH